MSTPAAPMPADYDSAVFNVDLVGLAVCIPAMTALINDISDDVVAVVNVISNLTLGWAGDTAAEVTAFFDAWNAAVTVLVGNDDPNATVAQSGTLNILAGALTTAMNNYDQTETVLVQQFQQFAQALTGGTGGASDPYVTVGSAKTGGAIAKLPAGVSDNLVSAVAETFSD